MQYEFVVSPFATSGVHMFCTFGRLECSAQSSPKLREFFLRNVSSSFRIAILVAFFRMFEKKCGPSKWPNRCNKIHQRQCFTQWKECQQWDFQILALSKPLTSHFFPGWTHGSSLGSHFPSLSFQTPPKKQPQNGPWSSWGWFRCIWVFPKIRGFPPTWMVYNGKPY